MTLLESAKKNIAYDVVKKVAALEKVPLGAILKNIGLGLVVIPQNINRRLKKPCAIGFGLTTKINANIGTSTDVSNLSEELNKLAVAIKYGSDTVMDLSVGPNLSKTRREIIKHSIVPVGTVPVYEIAVNAERKNNNFLKFDASDMLAVLEEQAKEGVDFFTIHSGVTKNSLRTLIKQKRVMGIVSRGGAILAAWIKENKKENPFFQYFDKILDICYKYDIVISLGDGLRPGSILDATDKAQIAELRVLGELAAEARRKNVQVIIEGPGHVPLDQIKKNVALEKKICKGAPFYVLGPLVTDIAAGYDHITAAIGGAIAASAGADFLCYVTPSEHLRHPSAEDVREGVIASKIAAHAADLVKIRDKAIVWDKLISQSRKKRDWKKQIALSIDPDKAKAYRASSKPNLTDVCTMCGKYCSIKVAEECLTSGR